MRERVRGRESLQDQNGRETQGEEQSPQKTARREPTYSEVERTAM